MGLDALIDLFDNCSSSIRAHLGKPAHVTGIESEGDDGVAASALGLGYDAGDGVVSGRVELFLCQLPGGFRCW